MSNFQLTSFRDTDYQRQFIFAGEMFKFEANLVNGVPVQNFQIKTGSKIPHFIVRNLVVSFPFFYQFSEDGIKANGAIQGVVAVNRQLSTTPTVGIFANPTTSTGGSKIILEQYPMVQPIVYRQVSDELILKSNSNYLISFSGGAFHNILFQFVWYESRN